MKKNKKKSLVGYAYVNWRNIFHEDSRPFVEANMPTLYKEKDLKNFPSIKVRITIEEI